MRLLIISLFVALLLSACGAAPAPEIASYPGAQAIETGSAPVADVLADAFAQELGGANRRSAVQIYRVPDTTTWDAIKQFYTGQLNGWQLDESRLVEGDTFSFIGWTRGNQLFALGFVDNASGEGAYLTTAALTR